MLACAGMSSEIEAPSDSAPASDPSWVRARRAIDRFSGVLGTAASWLALVMILIGAFNAVARYLGRFIGVNLSSNAYLELQWYLFSLVFLLGGSYALSRDAHVRVDVLYSRFGERTKAWVDLLGGVVFLLPFTIFSFFVSIPSVRNSIAVREVSADPGGLWRWPIKVVMLVCFAFLFVQGVAEVLRSLERLRTTSTQGDRT